MNLNVQNGPEYNKIVIWTDQSFCSVYHIYEDWESFKDLRPEFVDELLAIDGIMSLAIDDCNLIISKFNTVPWVQIYPEIQRVIIDNFADSGLVVDLSLDWFIGVLHIEGCEDLTINGIPVMGSEHGYTRSIYSDYTGYCEFGAIKIVQQNK